MACETCTGSGVMYADSKDVVLCPDCALYCPKCNLPVSRMTVLEAGGYDICPRCNATLHFET